MTALRNIARLALAIAALLVLIVAAFVGLNLEFLRVSTDAYHALAREAVDVEGDALSALIVLRQADRVTRAREHNPDQRAFWPTPPAAARIEQLRGQIAAEAPGDWRLLVLLDRHHRIDPPLPPPSVRERLQVAAGDNALIYILRFGAMADCCPGTQQRGDFAAAMAATRYEGISRAVSASVRDRYRRIPVRRISYFVLEAAYQDIAADVAASDARYMGADLDSSEFNLMCGKATGAAREACLHLALLVIRDAENSADIAFATGVVETIGGDEEKAVAQAKGQELDWLDWNARNLRQASSAPSQGPDVDRRFMDDLPDRRALLAKHGIALTPPPGWTKPPAGAD